MMIKSAVFATVLAGIAAASATSASAAPGYGSGYGYGKHGYQQTYRGNHYNSHRHNYRRPVVRTQTRCVGRHRVALRINSYGQVISRSVVGRCFSPRFWSRMNNR